MKTLREFFGLNYFTSELDLFLNTLKSKKDKISISQQLEIAKYKRIAALRDTPCTLTPNQSLNLWQDF